MQEAFRGKSGSALAGLVRVVPLARLSAARVDDYVNNSKSLLLAIGPSASSDPADAEKNDALFRAIKAAMPGYTSAILAFDLKGGLPAARKFCDRIQLFLLAASLGGVESLVVLPIYSSHYKMSASELAAAGVTPGTVRVSVGLEDAHDLIADLQQALA